MTPLDAFVGFMSEQDSAIGDFYANEQAIFEEQKAEEKTQNEEQNYE